MYIKILIQDVVDGIISTDVGDELSIILKDAGLKIEASDDIGEKLLWSDIAGYRYLFVRAYDLPNKNRRYRESQEEIDAIVQYIMDQGYETVMELPVVEA